MLTRTLHSSVVFRRPFRLVSIDGLQPAGTYDIEIEEELLEGLSFAAYRRVSTMMTLQQAGTVARRIALLVDPHELAEAHAADAR